MARRRNRRMAQTTMIVLSTLVALSLILSLLGPILLREPARPTPTPVPVMTRPPTVTPTATATGSAVPEFVGPDQESQ